MKTKEGTTKTVNLMMPGAGALVFGRVGGGGARGGGMKLFIIFDDMPLFF